jgi:CheY-like chemotaxis protein/anti-sigma regulatory factor (Ser/Thr protein kinase)
MLGLSEQDIRQRSLTVLVVDDEDFNLEIIGELLHDRGYHVDTAENGVQACQLLQKNSSKYQCVLLDRMMPEMDGMAVLQFIKNDPQLRYIPVIMQTAKATRKDIQDGLNAGVLYYITKPFNEATLLSIVDSAVEEFLRRQELARSVLAHHEYPENHGHFVFRTLDEARHIATVLANACPEPERVVFGLSELLINAVEHGNLGIGFEEKTRLFNSGQWHGEIERRLRLPEFVNKKVTVALDVSDEEIRFTIKDEGKGFDSDRYLQVDAERAANTHGRGIAMARMLSFDKVEYSQGGTTVLAAVKIDQD